MAKFLKYCVMLGAVCFALSLFAWMMIRHISIQKAEEHAYELVQLSDFKKDSLSENEKIIAITRQVYLNFRAQNPSEIPLLRLRSYITNDRLLNFLKLPSGVIETNIERGLCDNASRMLAFILKQQGFDSVQWNMVSYKGGHSALLVTMSDNRKAFVDPFYGVVAVDRKKNLIDASKAQELIRAGRRTDKVFMALDKKSKQRFYNDFSSVSMAAEGQDLLIKVDIPALKNKPLLLGSLDGSEKDVISAGNRTNMTPYWNYMGHKYNREWVRILKASEPMKIVITLTEDVDQRVLTATPTPDMQGKVLSWNLMAGQKIIFKDGDAKLSLNRMNSYLNVDQIAFYPAH
jgi:hypothetical protein